MEFCHVWLRSLMNDGARGFNQKSSMSPQELIVPLVVLTAQGIRRWPLRLLLLLLAISVGTYALGSAIWLVAV